MEPDFFVHEAIDKRWHTVYRVPGTKDLSSVFDAPSKAAAEAEAERLNKERAAKRHQLRDQLAALGRFRS